MKKTVLLLIATLAFCCLHVSYAQSSPVGTWTAISDKDGKPRSLIRIYQSKNKLYGRVVKVIPRPGDTGYCRKCPGAFKNKKVQGLRILWNMRYEGDNTWGGGRILDPKSGNIYRCKIKLVNPNTLKVRGYVGVSLFGRTATWTRR